MINDYGTIQNSRQIIEAEDFDEHINHFIELNASNSKKALNKFVTKILERFNLQLQVVRPRDAVQFLLYQEAYPEISEIISRMVRKHYDAYVNERAKARVVDNLQFLLMKCKMIIVNFLLYYASNHRRND